MDIEILRTNGYKEVIHSSNDTISSDALLLLMFHCYISPDTAIAKKIVRHLSANIKNPFE